MYCILLIVQISLSILFDLSGPEDLDKKNPENKIDETGKFVFLTNIFFNSVAFIISIRNFLEL